MQIQGWDIGVCGWSLQPTDAADLVRKVNELSLSHVQVGLSALLIFEESERAAQVKILRNSGLTLTGTSISFPGEDYTTLTAIRRSGGFVPDEFWADRRALTMRAAELTAALGVKFLELHAGFIPGSNDPAYHGLVERMRDVAKDVATHGVDLLLETGQESASELLQFLNDMNCRNVAVNFDPGNMILYGTGDPIEAVRVLNRHIRHVHLKDASESSQPRVQWGREMSLGDGQVRFGELFEALKTIKFSGVLAIERESGADRIAEIKSTIQRLLRLP